jgi:transglutaminase-like putative cysteine protease
MGGTYCATVGFDPTNNLIADEQHIRVAIGRDYADLPPTHGVFKGNAETELSVGVRISLNDAHPTEDMTYESRWIPAPDPEDVESQAQDQQK